MIGQTLGRYQILAKLGAGSVMGDEEGLPSGGVLRPERDDLRGEGAGSSPEQQ
jgi:hypothetical protein